MAAGTEGKPLMLLVHGFPEFWYSWRYQLREFSKEFRYKLQTCCFNVTVNQLEIPYVTRRKKVLSAYIHMLTNITTVHERGPKWLDLK